MTAPRTSTPLRPPPYLQRDSSTASASTQNGSPAITPEPGSPSSRSGNSSANELEDDIELEESSEASKIVPALASPTVTNPTSPWPFGSVSNRGRSNSVITAALDLSASQPSPSALPHEILLAIFRMVGSQHDLKSCIRVCKSWCQCGVELLWHKPNFLHAAALDHHLAVILAAEMTTFPYALFIKRLNFSVLNCYVNDEMLGQLSACSRMERLTMTACNLVTDIGLQHLFRGCHQVLALDLSDCVNLTDATCEAIASNLKRLQGLNLSGCSAISDSGIIAITRGCPSLRRMKLRGVDKITDLSMINLACFCKILLEIDLSLCFNITDVGVWAIWRNLPHLRELYLNGANLTERGFPLMQGKPGAWQALVYGEGIQEAVILGFDGKTMIQGEQQLATRSSDIIAGILNGTGIPYGLGEKLSMVANRHFQNIRVLDLTGHTQLTDAAVESIVTFMPKIRNLALAKCQQLTDESVFSICKLGKALHHLHLGHCLELTDRAVARLARSCTRLRYIDLAYCQHLTDASAFELANMTRLARIGLVRVVNLTDEAVFSLVECKTLERLHLSYCENISVQAVHFLLQSLTSLTHLSLTGVPSFRRADLQSYCRSPPKEFNAHQQQSFCVYSGRGVAELRRYLNQSMRDGMTTALDPRGNSRRNLGQLVNGLRPNYGPRPRRAHRPQRRPDQEDQGLNGVDRPRFPPARVALPSQQPMPPAVFFPPFQPSRSDYLSNNMHASGSRTIGSAPPTLGTFTISPIPQSEARPRMEAPADVVMNTQLPERMDNLAFTEWRNNPTAWQTPQQQQQQQQAQHQQQQQQLGPTHLPSANLREQTQRPTRSFQVAIGEPDEYVSDETMNDSDSESQGRRHRGRMRS